MPSPNVAPKPLPSKRLRDVLNFARSQKLLGREGLFGEGISSTSDIISSSSIWPRTLDLSFCSLSVAVLFFDNSNRGNIVERESERACWEERVLNTDGEPMGKSAWLSKGPGGVSLGGLWQSLVMKGDMDGEELSLMGKCNALDPDRASKPECPACSPSISAGFSSHCTISGLVCCSRELLARDKRETELVSLPLNSIEDTEQSLSLQCCKDP